MYKKVKQFASANGLTVEDKSGLAYGLLNGYFVLIQQHPTVEARHLICLWAKPANDASASAAVDYLNQCPARFQYLRTSSYNGTKIVAEFQGTGFQWGKNYVPCMESFLREITTYCRNNDFLPCCEGCGTQFGLNLYQLDGSPHMFCSSCYTGVTAQIQQNAIQKKKLGSGNVIGGIIGALLGSLLGVAAWVIIYELGYISALGGLIMVVCSMKGYELLGGRLNKLGIALSCIISVLMLFFAEQVCLSIEICKALSDFTFIEAFQSVPFFLSQSEIMAAAAQDVFIGLLLMVVAAFATVKQAYKENSASVSTRMVAPVTRSN
ncbi:MAG: hypothetical protein ACI4AA_01265 [Lachnospiraceae bacterium]